MSQPQWIVDADGDLQNASTMTALVAVQRSDGFIIEARYINGEREMLRNDFATEQEAQSEMIRLASLIGPVHR